MGAGHARSRYLNRKDGDAEGRASDLSEVITSGSLFLSNGEEDRNVPLKDSTETKMGCQERRGGRMGSWSDLNQSGDLRGGGLPCGRGQRFESAYLQLVNLADTKLYDSTQFFRFSGSIYDLSFMDVDKIHPFSSTLGWHSLKSEGRGSNEERLTVDT
ncbi:hypothetical protein BC332_06436 [Capsicum chinense]|nr:hypothetical protein BC332_06436 [Capsicum chinense]